MIKIKKYLLLIVLLGLSIGLVSCKKPVEQKIPDSFKYADNYENIYQVFVRSYADSNNDGIGDFKGLEAKLDYIKDLGFTAIWLMPIHPSPSYHGYDVTDYYGVNPDFGTLDDFKSLLKTSGEKGIDIYIDFVVNHSSSEHPWFKAALNNDAKYKDYYRFSNSSSSNYWRGKLGGGYYYAYFSESMPDLNLSNQNVINEINNITKYWIELGVDGYRLDGALHYFRTDELNSKLGNYSSTGVQFISTLSEYARSINPDFNIIVEAWDTSPIGVAPTFRAQASPIDFTISDVICGTAQTVNSTSFFFQLDSAYSEYAKYDKEYVPAAFLKNHDMDRLASWPGFSKIETQKMAVEILLSLPGSPIVYYGEELGMKGIRANGANGQYDETVRLPYVFGDSYETSWVKDYNKYNSSIDNAYKQLADSNSLLNTYKTLLVLRNNNIALKYSNNLVKHEGSTSQLLSYTRTATYNNKTQTVLVVHNISKSALNMIDCDGKVLYASNGATSLEQLAQIPGRSTVIIDITGGSN